MHSIKLALFFISSFCFANSLTDFCRVCFVILSNPNSRHEEILNETLNQVKRHLFLFRMKLKLNFFWKDIIRGWKLWIIQTFYISYTFKVYKARRLDLFSFVRWLDSFSLKKKLSFHKMFYFRSIEKYWIACKVVHFYWRKFSY